LIPIAFAQRRQRGQCFDPVPVRLRVVMQQNAASAAVRTMTEHDRCAVPGRNETNRNRRPGGCGLKEADQMG